MKRINKIVIDNYRAYCMEREIDLPNGENLLIYGENGSGKSSLYKGLNAFFKSFVSQISFVKNKFNPNDGKIVLSFADFDEANQNPLERAEETYTFGNDGDNTNVENVAFLKSAAMTKGFMDYKDLLGIYLHGKSKNLFDIFVTNILRHHSIGTTDIGREWSSINYDFYNTRKQSNLHRRIPGRLASLRDNLNVIFRRIEPIVNRYLVQYFNDANISIGFNLARLDSDDAGGPQKWNIHSELYLWVRYNGEDITDYEDFLNEARLAAVSLCIFLAALKDNESQYYKFLFLDDVFIGLDAANRIPILSILKDNFSDYQIIISTYDRYWYNLARHYFDLKMPERWKSIELYVGETKMVDGEISVVNPIVVQSEDDMDKAARYLHREVAPDYPAAANYLRKALERKLREYIPNQEFVDENDKQYEGYELTKSMKKAQAFLQKIHSDYDGLSVLYGCMHALLHPMSHFNEEDQIYRSELFEVERILKSMDMELKSLTEKYRLLCGKATICKIRFHKEDNSYTCEYTLKLKENLYVYKDQHDNICLSECKCESICASENDNGIVKNASFKNKYTSLQRARSEIFTYLNDTEHRNVLEEMNLDNMYYEDVDDFLPLKEEAEAMFP